MANGRTENKHRYRERQGNPKLDTDSIKFLLNLVLDVAGKKKKILVLERDEETGHIREVYSDRRIFVRYLEDVNSDAP